MILTVKLSRCISLHRARNAILLFYRLHVTFAMSRYHGMSVRAIVKHRTLRSESVAQVNSEQFIVTKSGVLQIQAMRLTRDHVPFILVSGLT